MSENSFLERSKQRESPQLSAALARLRRGQQWLVKTWLELRDLNDWGDQADVFQRSYDAWDLLEAETRSKWRIVGCVIGPEGCDKEAPLMCDFCAGRPTPKNGVIACERAGTAPEQKARTAEQEPLFAMGRVDH